MSVYTELVEVGCELEHHASDLYVKDSPEAREILARYRHVQHPFVDDIDGELWWDIPFAYDPAWGKHHA